MMTNQSSYQKHLPIVHIANLQQSYMAFLEYICLSITKEQTLFTW
jgi:hypothetical protein